jgi:hypothetical protein
MALRRGPSTPGPQPGEQEAKRTIHYPTDVQPVLDEHCVRCHGRDEPAAELRLTGEMTEHFSRSYENIWRLRLVKTFDEGADWDGSQYAPPRSVGSHASKLVAQIRKGCPGNDRELPKKDFIRIVTWVDANAQYYGTYYGRRHLRFRGHPEFRHPPTFDEAVATTAPQR